jgi:hypothetical protein
MSLISENRYAPLFAAHDFSDTPTLDITKQHVLANGLSKEVLYKSGTLPSFPIFCRMVS